MTAVTRNTIVITRFMVNLYLYPHAPQFGTLTVCYVLIALSFLLLVLRFVILSSHPSPSKMYTT